MLLTVINPRGNKYLIDPPPEQTTDPNKNLTLPVPLALIFLTKDTKTNPSEAGALERIPGSNLEYQSARARLCE